MTVVCLRGHGQHICPVQHSLHTQEKSPHTGGSYVWSDVNHNQDSLLPEVLKAPKPDGENRKVIIIYLECNLVYHHHHHWQSLVVEDDSHSWRSLWVRRWLVRPIRDPHTLWQFGHVLPAGADGPGLFNSMLISSCHFSLYSYFCKKLNSSNF